MPKTKYPIFKCPHRGEKGFTLIELLIVIVILGVIAALVIPNISKFKRAGDVEAANAELDSVRTAVKVYYMHQDPHACPEITPEEILGDGDILSDYLEGVTKYKYSIDSNCEVTGEATCSGLSGVDWDEDTKRWE